MGLASILDCDGCLYLGADIALPQRDSDLGVLGQTSWVSWKKWSDISSVYLPTTCCIAMGAALTVLFVVEVLTSASEVRVDISRAVPDTRATVHVSRLYVRKAFQEAVPSITEGPWLTMVVSTSCSTNLPRCTPRCGDTA